MLLPPKPPTIEEINKMRPSEVQELLEEVYRSDEKTKEQATDKSYFFLGLFLGTIVGISGNIVSQFLLEIFGKYRWILFVVAVIVFSIGCYLFYSYFLKFKRVWDDVLRNQELTAKIVDEAKKRLSKK